MKLTEEQKQALDDHIKALQAWRDDPNVELQWRYNLSATWGDIEPPLDSESDGVLSYGWYRLKPAPTTPRDRDWETP